MDDDWQQLAECLPRLARKYEGESPETLALRGGAADGVPWALVAQQIKGREMIREKLPSWFSRDGVVYPKSLSLEQCSSELAAQYKAEIVPGGEFGLDLTGGFGVDARFLGDRYRSLHCIERNRDLVSVAAWNFHCFGVGDKVSVRVGEASQALRELEAADLIYVDPARRDRRSLKVSALEDCEPNLLEHWDMLLAKAKSVLVKLSPGLDLSEGLRKLPHVAEVHVVAIGNECKELLFLAHPGHSGAARIHCVNIEFNGEREVLEFTLEEEASLDPQICIPSRFLYEPNAAIMKAGAFKTLCQRYPVKALSPRTRFYGSGELIEGFPGRVFEIAGKGALNAKDARRLFPEGKANVISRNSGMRTEELRKKLKLKDGGADFAIGATVSDVGRCLFKCRRVNGE